MSDAVYKLVDMVGVCTALPCPFCNGSTRVTQSFVSGDWRVNCIKCWAAGPPSPSEQGSIVQWNYRRLGASKSTALAAQPQPEPVGEAEQLGVGDSASSYVVFDITKVPVGTKLYAAPPPLCAEHTGDPAKQDSARVEWQPIETAPKDGSPIMLASAGGVWIGAWVEAYQSGYSVRRHISLMLNHRHVTGSAVATHWAYLPTPPAGDEA